MKKTIYAIQYVNDYADHYPTMLSTAHTKLSDAIDAVMEDITGSIELWEEMTLTEAQIEGLRYELKESRMCTLGCIGLDGRYWIIHPLDVDF